MNRSNEPTRIDGHRLYHSFLRGAEEVIKKKKAIDEINVFPVSDGDTGENLAKTLRSVAHRTAAVESVSTVSNNMAEAALMGSQGNSGIIFAQFLQGISRAAEDNYTLDLNEYARVMQEAAEYVYQVTNEPVEGTILTVMRDWAQALDRFTEHRKSLAEAVEDSLQAARNSLRKTTYQLEVLQREGVVDAGAKGFVHFLEGVFQFLRDGQPANFTGSSAQPESLTHTTGSKTAPSPRYCTEALLKVGNSDLSQLRQQLESLGESIMVARAGQKARIHIHTDNPPELFGLAKERGQVLQSKVDDMLRQYQAANTQHPDVAVVTDSTCDLPPEVIDRYNIHVIPLRISFGPHKFLDKIGHTPDQFYQALEQLEPEDEYPQSSQPPVSDFVDTYSFLLDHYDSVLSLHLASPLSGTYDVAVRAAEEVEDKIEVIDTKQLSTSLGLIVCEVARSVENGASLQHVAEQTRQLRDKAKILVSVRNLKYMIRGGRVSKLKGFLANLVNFKPIISLDKTGDSELYGRAIFRRSNFRQMVEIMKDRDQENGIKSYAIGHAHAEDMGRELAEQIQGALGTGPEYIMDISPLIGSHAGSGAVSVSFVLY